MSDYFDGLMRSSGLSLGHAPVLRPSLQEAAPLTEIDVVVPAAEPVIGPLEVTAQSIPQVTATPPPPRHATVTTAHPPAAAPGPAGSPAKPATAGPAPQTGAASQMTASGQEAAPFALPAEESGAEPGVSHERIIQAVMRWVAAGPPRLPARPDPCPIPRGLSGRSSIRAGSQRPQLDTAHSSSHTTIGAQPDKTERATRLASADVAARPRAIAIPVPQAMPPIRDETVQVHIGAIHLRVEAPLPPAVQAASVPATPPRRPSDTQVAPPSGLSRRALRRI